MVKTKNGVSKLVALVLILTLAVASLLLALSTNRKSVYAATASVTEVKLYNDNTLRNRNAGGLDNYDWNTSATVAKTQAQLVSDGDISITNGQLTILNKNLSGQLLVKVVNNSLKDLFKDCKNLTDIYLDAEGATDVNGTFENCTGLKGCCLILTSKNDIENAGKIFKGCSSLEMLNLETYTERLESMQLEKTYAEIGLDYDDIHVIMSMYEFSGKNSKIVLSGHDVTTLSSYNPSEETPSTGIETNLIGFGVTAIILVAICYIVGKKYQKKLLKID